MRRPGSALRRRCHGLLLPWINLLGRNAKYVLQISRDILADARLPGIRTSIMKLRMKRLAPSAVMQTKPKPDIGVGIKELCLVIRLGMLRRGALQHRAREAMISGFRICAVNCVVVTTFIAIGFWSPAPAAAQTQQQIDWCLNQGSPFPPDLQIGGCTASIQSGDGQGKPWLGSMSAAATPTTTRRTTTAPSPTTIRRSSSIRNMPTPTSAAASRTTT